MTFELPGFSSGAVEDSIPPRLDVQDFFSDLLTLEDNGIIVLRVPHDAVSHSKRTQSSRTHVPTGHFGTYYAEIKLAATCNKNEQQQMPK